MFKSLVAYLFVFFLAPTVGSLVGLAIFLIPVFSARLGSDEADTVPRAGLSSFLRRHALSFRGAISAIGAFVAVWFGTVVFSWFDVRPSASMVIMLGLGYTLNDLRRIRHSPPSVLGMELAGGVGDLLGVIAGGIYLI